MKKKILMFHPALAPYRVDQLNALNNEFELEVIFLFENLWNHKFNQQILLDQLTFKYSYLLFGPSHNGKTFRFGMLKHINRANPDIIIGYEYSFTTQFLIMLKILGLINSKIGTTIDDSIDISKSRKNSLRGYFMSLMLKKLDFLIFISEDIVKFYKLNYNYPEKRMLTFPIIQDPNKLKKDSSALLKLSNIYTDVYNLNGKKVLLFVGRFIKEKGILNFLSIIAPVLKSRSDIVLVLVGDGDERDNIESLIDEFDINNYVILPGRFEGNQLLAWYLCASGFVLPSFSETFGAVVNEALIFGLPVFCSKYAGSSFLLNNNMDQIFDPNDIVKSRSQLSLFIDGMSVKSSKNLFIPDSRMKLTLGHVTSAWKKKFYD